MQGNEIRQRRESLNMSQQQFATALGVTKKTVEAWEGGWRKPRHHLDAIKALQPLPEGQRMRAGHPPTLRGDGPGGNSAVAVREARKKLGMTQMQFAKTLGVSLTTVEVWEAGARKPRPDVSERIRQLAYPAA